MLADTLIRGGHVIDGTGSPPVTADVALRNGRIEAIGPGEPIEAREIIEAGGLVVAPGFIDIHSHGDLVLAWPSDRRLALLQGRLARGITTEVIGNCGLGVAAVRNGSEGLLRQVNGWMSPASFPWSWKDLSAYFRHLEKIGIPMNVGALVPRPPPGGPAHDLASRRNHGIWGSWSRSGGPSG